MVSLSNEQVAGLPTWLPVRDFEGLYEVNCREGKIRNARTLKVLKLNPDSNGYPCVGLYKNGRCHTNTVHRIVANAAFGCYDIQTDGLLVLHLDETRTNSVIGNLALGTAKENLNFPKAKQRNSEAQKGERNHNFGKHKSAETRKKMSDAHAKRAVGAFKDGRLILKFESIMDAHRNDFDSGAISNCCKGRLKHHRGFEWRFL